MFARDGEAEGLEFFALVLFYDFFAEFFGEGGEEVWVEVFFVRASWSGAGGCSEGIVGR